MKNRKLFCEYGKVAYNISLKKECIKRDIKDLFEGNKFAKKRKFVNFKYIWKGDAKILLRELHGVDMQLQKNKIKNLTIDNIKLDNIVI